MPPPAENRLSGIGYVLLANLIWGAFPIFFHLLASLPPLDLLVHRIVWTFIFSTLLLWITARRPYELLLQSSRSLLAICALLLGGNWWLFLWGVDTHQVLAVSLGYFMTPLLTVLLGTLVLGEKLSTLQWVATGLAGIAVANEIVHLGHLPWLSLGIAITFSLYSLLRKKTRLNAIDALWVDAFILLLPAIIYEIWRENHGGSILAGQPLSMMALLMMSGVITGLPLLAFAAGSRRIPLVTVGMIMNVGPFFQMLSAIFVFHEPVSSSRYLSFVFIWAGLILYSYSSHRRAPPAA